ncbi:LAQU0S02e09780g1_1 [Lachancea quebecensis]|uniref:LAQU0S02e09780g1_1 n=1 Tax=Lachancea quebecensis TaxID=1654605 RepID=A0A0P1KR50_9SACH|nr:LAQU0S02e09780g1_1 [Lachancea quebecensis]
MISQCLRRQPMVLQRHQILRRASQNRPPPRSLLQRQAKRRGEVEAVAPSQLIVTSLKDIFSTFQPSGFTQEDDDLEAAKHKEEVIQRLENGELRELLLRKFGASRIPGTAEAENSIEDLRIPSQNISQAFHKLTKQELELIETFQSLVPPSMNWSNIPLISKQLQFYISFGSYGPREGISFLGSKPEDFIWRKTSKRLPPHQTVKRLSKHDMTNTWACIPSRKANLERMKKGLDPGTRIVAWLGILIVMIASLRDYKQRQDTEATVSVSEFIEQEAPSPQEPQQGAPLLSKPPKSWYQFWKR